MRLDKTWRGQRIQAASPLPDSTLGLIIIGLGLFFSSVFWWESGDCHSQRSWVGTRSLSFEQQRVLLSLENELCLP